MRKLITQYAGLPRPIYILFVSKIVDAAGCFIWPLLALILTRKVGLTSFEAGTVASTAMIASALAPFLGGKLADVIGRKRTIAIFTAAAIVSYGVCGFIPPSIAMMVFIVLGMTFLSAASPAHDALVADLVSPERRQSAYSLLYLGWNVGFAAGPAIGAFLLDSHLNVMFIGDAATALAALVMVMLFVPEIRRAESVDSPAPRAEAAEKGSIVQVLMRRPVLLVLTLILFGYSFTYVQWGFLLPLQLSTLFSEAGTKAYGIVALVNGLTVIVANPSFSLMFKRMPLPRVIFIGGIFYAAGLSNFDQTAFCLVG